MECIQTLYVFCLNQKNGATMLKSFCTTLLLTALVATVSAQDWALERLNASPRHHEWVTVEHDGRAVEAFLAFPEVEEKALAVVVIHENRGLNDWVRGVADQLAEAGYIAIAPDLLSGMGPDGGKTSDFADSDAARQAIYQLDPAQVTADLQAVADYVAALPAANGNVAVAGFCWGGSQTFRFATDKADLVAAFVFYGSAPEDGSAFVRIQAPVFGFYGGDDARIAATIPQTIERMETEGKRYEPLTYAGAGHGFMRSGEAPDADEANKKAREESWVRWKALLASF
jgi:carboxymethylenebutenolidase